MIKAQEEITDDINMFLALKHMDSDNEKFPLVAFKRRESEKEEKKKNYKAWLVEIWNDYDQESCKIDKTEI